MGKDELAALTAREGEAMDKLKPCPLCAGRAWWDAKSKRIWCLGCGLSTCIDDKRNAVADWNTRLESALAKRMRVLEEALKRIGDNDPDCECDDHTSIECCDHIETDVFCARCIAAKALLAQPAQSGDTDKQADASEEGRDAR
jgi:hypothetical protein